MKKLSFLVCLVLLMISTYSYAENKLLITDVLDAKQIGMSLEATYLDLNMDVSGQIHGSSFTANMNGNEKSQKYTSEFIMNFGLGYGLELSTSIPYTFSKHTKTEIGTDIGYYNEEYSRSDGFGDLDVSFKYRLMGDSKKTTSVVAGVGVKFQTARTTDDGTGSREIKPFIAASTVINNFRPYMAYTAEFSNNGKSDTHEIEIGTEWMINDKVTIKPGFHAIYFQSDSDNNSHKLYGVDVATYLNIYRNMYVIPSIAVAYSPFFTSKDENLNFDSTKVYGGALKFYCLFN